MLILSVFSVRGEAVIRSFQSLRAACRDNRRNLPFEISGTVVFSSTLPRGTFVLYSEGELIPLIDTRTGQTSPAAVGERVRATGRTEPCRAKKGTAANCYSLCRISSGTVPEVAPTRIRDFLADTNGNMRIVALQGIVQDVFPDDIDSHHVCAILGDGTDTVNIVCSCPRAYLPGFRALQGCTVIARGLRTTEDINAPRYLGSCLRIDGTNAFRVVSRPNDYPFDAPDLIVGNETDPRFIATLGTRRIQGTVIASWENESFLLLTSDGKVIRVDLVDGPAPSPQASVEAVGTVETDLCDLSLSRAFWRPGTVPPAATGTAERTSLADLFTNTRRRHATINVAMHGRALTLEGTVKSVSRDESGSRRLLLADGEHAILVVCGPNAAGDPPPEEGWRVAITGVCVKDSDVWRPTVPIPKIRGLFLVTRSDGDIVVLRKTPWWTPARLAIAIAILLTVLVAIVIWNATLRILVARRSREVIKAQTAKIESELRIGERTRLAADLHDNTVQNLTAIAYRITAAQGALGSREPEAGRILQVAAKMLKSCRTSLRQCLWDLRNDALNEPDFETAIRRTVETVAGDARLSIRFSGRRDLINDTTAHAVLSILRELVSNATVHGEATAVSIAGEAHPGAIRFSVSDNGTGFDPAQRPGQDDGHFGLDGITERLESLGGILDITSSAEKGTYVRITIQRT